MDEDAPTQSLACWETAFRVDAEADGYAVLREHLDRFGLAIDARQMIEATVDFVGACDAFGTLDGDASPGFLSLQAYRPEFAAGATYVLTFDVAGSSAARVVTGADLRGVDFADLYAMPWTRYEVVGYSRCFVTRVDGHELSTDELNELESLVTKDLCFDYAGDEIDFWFDVDSFPGALVLEAQDHVVGDPQMHPPT